MFQDKGQNIRASPADDPTASLAGTSGGAAGLAGVTTYLLQTIAGLCKFVLVNNHFYSGSVPYCCIKYIQDHNIYF